MSERNRSGNRVEKARRRTLRGQAPAPDAEQDPEQERKPDRLVRDNTARARIRRSRANGHD